MRAGTTGTTGTTGAAQERLAPLFVGIVLVEILTIAGLYWMGVHFS
jgi:hypothetical protein